MTAAWVLLRALLRQRWRSWLALALLVGAFAGAVGAASAGARRTDSAYPSLLAWSRAPDILIFTDPYFSSVFAHIRPAAIAGLPQVAEVSRVAEYAVQRPAEIALLAPESNVVPGSFWRRKILAGGLPDPGRADEVDISFTLAQARHLRVGRRFASSCLPPTTSRRPSHSGSPGSTQRRPNSLPRPGQATISSGPPRRSTASTPPGSSRPSPARPCGSGTEPQACRSSCANSVA